MKKSVLYYGAIFSLAVSGCIPLVSAVLEPSQKDIEARSSSVVAEMAKECWEGSKIMGASIAAAIAYGASRHQKVALQAFRSESMPSGAGKWLSPIFKIYVKSAGEKYPGTYRLIQVCVL